MKNSSITRLNVGKKGREVFMRTVRHVGWTRLIPKMVGMVAFPAMVFVAMQMPGVGLAAGGDYSITFSAARPGSYGTVYPATLSYPRPEGGIASDPLDPPGGEGAVDAIFGEPQESVTSLAPAALVLGQIVPFEIKIEVSGGAQPQDGVIEFSAGWGIRTSSGALFGYSRSCGVYSAFVDASDGASRNLDGNEKVSSYSWVTTSDEIQGTFTVAGLDAGDVAVVEVWLVLDEGIAAGVSGDVRSRLISAHAAGGEGIEVGEQAVTLQRAEEFFNTSADLSVTMSDSGDSVVSGGRFLYTIEVRNNSVEAVANGVVLTNELDPNTSFVSMGIARVDSEGNRVRTLFLCGEEGKAMTCALGAMLPGEVATLIIEVDVLPTAPVTGAGGTGPCMESADLCSSASVSAIGADPDPANNSDSEPTGVIPSSEIQP